MGSRRKHRDQRSTAGAAGVSRQARGATELPAGTTTGSHPAIAVPHPPPVPEARPDTGRHPRVVPVTRQTEDGSFELVYEAVDVEDEGADVAPHTPAPLWRRRPVQWAGFGVLALALLVGGLVAVTVAFGPSEPKARKVATAKKGSNNGPNEVYEYVPPAKNDGRIDLAGDSEDDDGAPPPGEAIAPSEPGTGEIPEGSAVAPPLGAAGGSGAPDPPGIDDGFKAPGIQLRPSLPEVAPRLGDPLKVRQDVLRDRLGTTGLAGTPTGPDDSEDDPAVAGTGADDEETGPGNDEEGADDESDDDDDEEDPEAEEGTLDERLDDEAEREDDEVEREDDELPE